MGGCQKEKQRLDYPAYSKDVDEPVSDHADNWLRIVSAVLLVLIAAGSAWFVIVGLHELLEWAAR